MIAKALTIGMALVMAGCAYQPKIIFGDRISGNADSVAIKASYVDPGPQASRHCAKYEKTAEFDSVTGVWWRWFGGGNEYLYKCK